MDVMKVCNKCKIDKSDSSFAKNKSMKDGLQRSCRDCIKYINAEYYKRTPHLNSKRRASHEKARAIAKGYIYDYLNGHPCIDCSESNLIVLDFDHVRDRKILSISVMVTRGFGIDTIKKEIDKCEVRCSNCHRIKTYQRAGWTKYNMG